MSKDAVIQVRIDADIKERVELLYKQLGTSFGEVVRMLAQQSLYDQGIPFTLKLPQAKGIRKLGIANGKYNIPDNIDSDNAEIEKMFQRDK